MLKKSSRIIVPQDPCLIIQSSIAKKIGRTNALFLQQLHYKITSGDSVGVIYEGKRWVYNTYQDWVNDIKTISKSTIKRSIAFLKSKGIIDCRALSKNRALRINYYTINYRRLNEVLGLTEDKDLDQAIPSEIQNESIINGSFPHRVKMNQSSGQNELMLYTEITSDIKINISEQATSQNNLPSAKTNKSKQVNEIKKNYLPELLIDAWFQIVEQGKGELHLTKKRAQFLVAAFNLKFEKSMEKWKKYCQDIASSRFLMGEIKSSFRATLDWALKFEVIQKILEGNYGIGDRIPKAVLPSQIDLQEEILSSDESQEIKNFRTLCLKIVGNANYISNFKKLNIEFRDGEEIALIAPHKFGADFLEQNCYSYLRLILEGLEGPITRISILAPGEERGRLIERKKEGKIPTESSIEHSNDQKFPMEKVIPTDEHLVEASVKSLLEGTQNLPEYESIKQDADFLANLNGYEEEGVAFKDIPLQDISLETNELRTQLRKNILPRQFPTWLGSIEVEGGCRDGTVVVALEDAFAVEWCRSRFSKEVFEAAASLWKGVTKLIIRKKEGDLALLPIEKLPKRSENVAEKSTLEQAIQSLRSVCSTGPMREFEMQGACGVFG